MLASFVLGRVLSGSCILDTGVGTALSILLRLVRTSILFFKDNRNSTLDTTLPSLPAFSSHTSIWRLLDSCCFVSTSSSTCAKTNGNCKSNQQHIAKGKYDNLHLDSYSFDIVRAMCGTSQPAGFYCTGLWSSECPSPAQNHD